MFEGVLVIKNLFAAILSLYVLTSALVIGVSASATDVDSTTQATEVNIEEVTESQVTEPELPVTTEVVNVTVTSLEYKAGCNLTLAYKKDGAFIKNGKNDKVFVYNYTNLIKCDGSQLVVGYSDGTVKTFVCSSGVFSASDGEVLDESLLVITDTQAQSPWNKVGSYCVTLSYNGFDIQVSVNVECDCLSVTPKQKNLEVTTSGITVSWKKAKNAEGYLVYRRLEGKTKWNRIAKTKKLSYKDKGVKNNKSYEYAVKSYNEFDFTSDYSEIKSMKFVSAPKVKSLTNTTDGINVRWNKVNGAERYLVYRRGAGVKKWTYLGKTTKNTFLDTKAKAGKYWRYAVKAVNEDKSAFYTNGPTVKRLNNPTNLKTAEFNKCVSFTWKKSAGAKEYVVYRKDILAQKWSRVKTTKKNFYADKSVNSGKTYVYTVRAVSDKHKSSYNPNGVSEKYTATNLQYYVNTVSNGEYVWPVPYDDVLVSSRYKMRTLNGRTRMHNGIDVVRECNTHGSKVVAVKEGRVITASTGYNGGYGNYVVIDHGNGVETTYAHLSSVNCSRGDTVKQGELIGKVGNTGYSFGAHLHFGIMVNGEWKDPFLYLTQTEGWVRCTDV